MNDFLKRLAYAGRFSFLNHKRKNDILILEFISAQEGSLFHTLKKRLKF